MLPRIETSEVMRRATLAFDEHNRNCPVSKHKRQTASGEIEVIRRIGIIPEAVTTTFHTLLTEYVHNYNRMREQLPLEFQDPANPPALRTNAVRVARYARCTDRTIRNHVSRLKKLGFISTKFHGTKHDFELWITHKFLFGEQLPDFAQKAAQSALLGPERKNFPHTSTHLETLGTETSDKDMLISHVENDQVQKGRTETTKEPLGDGIVSRREEKEGGGPRREKSEIVAENDRIRRQKATAWLDERTAALEAAKPKGPSGMDSKYLKMLFEFWLYAWKVIYPNRHFSKEQQEKALIAIAAGVYGDFQEKRSEKDWIRYQVFQMEKLDKAARYYDRHPDNYRPDPYSVFVPGKGYFDQANLRGFVGIDAWMKSDQVKKIYRKKASQLSKQKKMEAAFQLAEQKKQKDLYCENLLRKARTDFEKLHSGAELRQEVKHMDQLALFQYYNTIFAGQSDNWQEKFCKQFLDQQARNFSPPKYRKSRRHRANAGEKSPATIVVVEDWMHFGEGYDPSWAQP